MTMAVIVTVLGLYVILGILAFAVYCIAVAPPFENPNEEQFQDACLLGCVWPLAVVALVFLSIRSFVWGVRGGLRRHLSKK
ncbi:hypothetical protein [Pseudomonas phage LKD16]|uniref:Transmembrane protein n=1 Tax=Pseudomonas phage LKD16 TaxID=386792 RepID=Q0E657_9CAUD|nr:hypothetical protein PPLKD16_gp08 [Pseudomonas phage LKD16]CAK25942.1 hypothetical protein [Pseudomonas phage LKD16]